MPDVKSKPRTTKSEGKTRNRRRKQPLPRPAEPMPTAPDAPVPEGMEPTKKTKRYRRTKEEKAALGVVRAVELPVARVIGMKWQDVDARVDPVLEQCRNLRNWAIRQRFIFDPANRVVGPLPEKLPPLLEFNKTNAAAGLVPDMFLLGRQIAPALNSGSASQALNDAADCYKKHRWWIFHKNENLPSYKRGQVPFRHSEVGDKIYLLGRRPGKLEGRPAIALPLPDPTTGANAYVTFLLRGGREHGRAYRTAQQMGAGIIELRTAYLLRRWDRKTRQNKLWVKLVYRKPPAATDTNRSGSLLVGSHRDSLLFMIKALDKRLSQLHHDDIKRVERQIEQVVKQRSEIKSRVYDDMRRDDAVKRERLLAHLQTRLTRCEARLNNAVFHVALVVVNTALRRKCNDIVLRYHRPPTTPGGAPVTDTSFVSSFPWFKLKSRIETLCAEHGLGFFHDEEAVMVPMEPLPRTDPNVLNSAV